MSSAAAVVEVAAALIVRDGQVLITRRRDGAHLGGFWEFPGGKRNPGETFEACLIREIGEEVGLTVAVHEQVATAEHRGPDGSVRLRFYRCTIVAGDPQPLGCDAWRWVGPAEIAGYPFPPADRPLVERIAAGIVDLSDAAPGALDAPP
jgi:mutator protein MutT